VARSAPPRSMPCEERRSFHSANTQTATSKVDQHHGWKVKAAVVITKSGPPFMACEVNDPYRWYKVCASTKSSCGVNFPHSSWTTPPHPDANDANTQKRHYFEREGKQNSKSPRFLTFVLNVLFFPTIANTHTHKHVSESWIKEHFDLNGLNLA